MELKEMCAKKLSNLRPDVTLRDKQEAVSTLNYSRQTIESYLKGQVKKTDVAIELIEFFTQKKEQKLQKLMHV